MNFFVSFTTTLFFIAMKKVSFTDLQKGYFFFSCSKSNVFSNRLEELSWAPFKSTYRKKRALRWIKKAIKEAEKKGTASWEGSSIGLFEGARAYAEIKQLLGIPELPASLERDDYNYMNVKKAEKDLGVNVIFWD